MEKSLFNIDVHLQKGKCLELKNLNTEAIHQVIEETIRGKELTIIQITPIDWMTKDECTCDQGMSARAVLDEIETS